MRRLVVFARRPVAGQVKTRLSPALPPDLAADLYRALLEDALATAAAAGADRVSLLWATAGPDPAGAPDPPGIVVGLQRGEGLGERLAAAFAELLCEPADRAVVMGADCPDLSPAEIHEAFAALETHDLVLGPAEDGGYYLIGLRRPAPGLFEAVDWGTERVLEQTLDRARGAGLSVARLQPLADLDTPADLVAFAARRSVLPGGPASRTAAALRAMGLIPPAGPS